MTDDLSFGGDFSNLTGSISNCLSMVFDSDPDKLKICTKTVALVVEVAKLNKVCNVKTKMHQLIDASDSYESLREKALKEEIEAWIHQFLNDISTKKSWSREEAHTKLTEGFEKVWFNSIGWKMVTVTVDSFAHSLKAWVLFYNFRRQLIEVLPLYQQRHESMKKQLQQCADILSTLNGVKVLNDVQTEKLELVQNYLNFVQANIEETVRDLKTKIGEAKRARSDNFWAGLINFVKSLIFGTITYKRYTEAGRNVTSTFTSTACTVGMCYLAFIDFVHAGLADNLVKFLEEEMKTWEEVQKRHKDLCEDLKKIQKETTIQT